MGKIFPLDDNRIDFPFAIQLTGMLIKTYGAPNRVTMTPTKLKVKP